MSQLARFAEYADAFERTLADDNWQRLVQYFTPDAVYAPGDGTEIAGRDNVLAHLQDSVNALDRRFDSRAFADTPPPTEDGNVVTLIWALEFGKAGVPGLAISGTEQLTWDGDRIARMQDVFDAGVAERLASWMATHGHALG